MSMTYTLIVVQPGVTPVGALAVAFPGCEPEPSTDATRSDGYVDVGLPEQGLWASAHHRSNNYVQLDWPETADGIPHRNPHPGGLGA